MRNKKIFPLLLAAVALSVAACSSSNSRGEAAPELLGIDSLPPDIQNLVRAVAKNDTLSFAAAVSYPLQRPYPLRDIATDSAMRTYYGVLMDDSLRNVIIDNPGKSWVDCGWRGWSAGDGNYIWFDGGIYAIPYMSKRETAMRDSLVRVEMASLYKPMRRGWQPVACYRGVGNDSVFRIDMRQPANKAPQFRLAAYASPAGLRNRPAAEYLGYRRFCCVLIGKISDKFGRDLFFDLGRHFISSRFFQQVHALRCSFGSLNEPEKPFEV